MRLSGLAAVVWCAGALSACATTTAVSRPATPTSSASAPASPEEGVVQSALALVGTPYHYGGDTPQSGFDCSGFVEYVMSLEDVAMPRTVGAQYRVGQSVTRSRLKAGDLVFFSTTGPGPTHVGIVTDPDQGEFVHAPSDGSRVRLDRLDNEYWKKHWIGAKRVIAGPRPRV